MTAVIEDDDDATDSTTAAILPVKSFAGAKQRLGGDYSAAAREDLAEAMLEDVLSALAAVTELEELIVVTAEPRAVALAGAHGATVVDDPDEAGQSAAAKIGLERAGAFGHQRALLVPGDCPTLDPGELTGLLSAQARPPAVTIVPDRHGTGTNALLLCPLDAIEPAFGPYSCARHRQGAEDAGISPVVARVRSLGLDVDTPEDLASLQQALEGAGASRAPRTRAALERLSAGASA
jgi:2-phospho-L-lactate guanylyltransferase